MPWTACVGWPFHKVAAPPSPSSYTTSLIHRLALLLSSQITMNNMFIDNYEHPIQFILQQFIYYRQKATDTLYPLLTSTQALKVLSNVKGSPWLLCRDWRAVAQSGLCCELRRNGDWTLRAAATVNTDSTRLNREPRTNIFPEKKQTNKNEYLLNN